ncbi:MAG: YfiR family protein [Verrucomicrobia bacterium]|nr:YfiR family protein [Verrucomicrobiota bacterium]
MLTHRRGWRSGLGRRIGWLLGLVLLATATPAAETPPSAEYQLKAVFLYNFAQFVEWPARAFARPDAPLIIGVLGDDPFGPYLDELVRGEKIGRRTLEVRRFKHTDDIADCHILFISPSERATLEKSLDRLGGRPVLTVSDLDTFTRQGGMVRFVTEGGKIRLRINVAVAKTSDLKISSKILGPATVVTTGKD